MLQGNDPQEKLRRKSIIADGNLMRAVPAGRLVVLHEFNLLRVPMLLLKVSILRQLHGRESAYFLSRSFLEKKQCYHFFRCHYYYSIAPASSTLRALQQSTPCLVSYKISLYGPNLLTIELLDVSTAIKCTDITLNGFTVPAGQGLALNLATGTTVIMSK